MPGVVRCHRFCMVFMIFSFFFFSVSDSAAQEFGGNPPSLKWKQINNDTVRVIFPSGQSTRAQRVASLVMAMARDTSLGLGDQLHKIDIVLQNQTTISNGYVGLGPYRSEFYLTAPRDNFSLGSLNWVDALATHEYRHVQQFNHFRVGASKLMYTLFGEEGLAVATAAAIPDWFYEGDAVYQETRLSNQGRGRIPAFLNEYPALWKANKNYSWMKLRNGSLKDYIPSHYPLGYLLVNYGYSKYGNGFWPKVTREASAYKGLFYPFQKSILRNTGIDYTQFKKDAFDYYKKLIPDTETSGRALTRINTRYVQNDLFPYQAGPDSLVFLRTTYRHRPAFFIQSPTGMKRLRVRDISIEDQFSYRNGQIVYAAYRPDKRWAWRNYSELRLVDVATGIQKKLTRHTRYFTPDLSPDGEQVVAVQLDTDGGSALHILSAKTGELIKALANPDSYIFTDPKFVDAANLVSAVRIPDGRMGLALIDLASGNLQWLTHPGYSVIGFPQVNNRMVYFSGSYDGNDDLYAISLDDRQLKRITSDVLGNYQVNVRGDSAVFSHFTAEGFQLRKLGVRDLTDGKWGIEKPPTSTRFPVTSLRDQRSGFLQETPAMNFSESKYRQSTRLFNFHSWRPYYEDPEFRFSLYGENVLNTLQSELYYLYNQNERTHAVGFSETFAGWFPFLSVGSQLTFQRQDSVNGQIRQWNQVDTRVGINVPLNFTSGQSFKSLNIGTNYFLRNEFNTGPNKDQFSTNSFTYLHHYLTWSQQVQMTRQSIFPKLGYNFTLQHRYPVTKFSGYQFIGTGNLYLPGILETHSIQLFAGFQQRDTLRALFSNRLAGSRGYNNYYLSRMWTFTSNYHLPLLLPDWGFGNILYINRVRANLFYDFQRVFSNNKQFSRDLRSVGTEIYFDTKWWNQYELTFGLRVNHLLDNDLLLQRRAGATWVELLLPVAIIPR